METKRSKAVGAKENFLCVECGSCFIHHASLLRHRLRFHITGHKCTLCQAELRSGSSESGGFADLKKHMLDNHQISNFYSCGCCCWIFSNKSHLHMHCKSMNSSGGSGPAVPIATVLASSGIYENAEEGEKTVTVTKTNEENVPSPNNDVKKTPKRSSGPRPKKKSGAPSLDEQFVDLYKFFYSLNNPTKSESSEETSDSVKSEPLNDSDGESQEIMKPTDESKASSSDLTNTDNAVITNELMTMLAKSMETAQKVENKELLFCRDCGASFSNKSSLYRHSIKTHLEAHICCLCDEEILVSNTDGSDNMMRRHMLTLHNISNVYTCSCCFWAFDNKKDLYNHNNRMMNHGEPGDYRKIATSRKKMQVTEQTLSILTDSFSQFFQQLSDSAINALNDEKDKDNNDDEPEKIEDASKHETLSDNEAASDDMLVMDVPSSEEDENSKDAIPGLKAESDGSLKRPDLKGQFGCLDCGKLFCHSASLHRHRGKVHVYDYECQLCSEVLHPGRLEVVKEHMLTRHQIASALVCWCCGWCFDSKKSLNLHINNLKTLGETGDAIPVAKSLGPPPSIEKKRKVEEKQPEIEGMKDFSSFVALFCPEVSEQTGEDVLSTSESSRDISLEQSLSLTVSDQVDFKLCEEFQHIREGEEKGDSLSPQLNAESCSSSTNDVTSSVNTTPLYEPTKKPMSKRKINDIASVLMSKKMKTSEA